MNGGQQPPTPPQALIIDDEADIVRLLTSYLCHLGYGVAVAETGERGVALAKVDPPELVLVDVVLPGIDGREVVRRLRADRRTDSCAIVVCSVLDQVDVDDVDADLVITKPFRRGTFLEMIKKLANRRDP